MLARRSRARAERTGRAPRVRWTTRARGQHWPLRRRFSRTGPDFRAAAAAVRSRRGDRHHGGSQRRVSLAGRGGTPVTARLAGVRVAALLVSPAAALRLDAERVGRDRGSAPCAPTLAPSRGSERAVWGLVRGGAADARGGERGAYDDAGPNRRVGPLRAPLPPASPPRQSPCGSRARRPAAVVRG